MESRFFFQNSQALQDNMKYPVVAKLSEQTSVLYGKGLALLSGNQDLLNYCGKQFYPFLEFRTNYSEAVAQYHLGHQAYHEAKTIGVVRSLWTVFFRG
mgnify:CR=1 FL=1